MSKAISVPDEVYESAARLAALDRVSVEEFLSTVVADQVSSRQFFDERAKRFDRQEFERVLAKVPDVPPAPEDRI